MTEQQRARRAPVRPREPARNTPVVNARSSGGKRRTAAEILADVGDDPAKAQAAYDDEMNSDKPRSTLLNNLDRIAGGDET